MKYKEILVPVRIAKKLRKIGFDKKCHFFWNFYDDVYDLCCYADRSEDDNYLLPNAYNYNDENSTGYYVYLSMPTYEQVFAWFREKGFECNIESYYDIFISKRIGYLYSIEVIENDMRAFTYNDDNCFDTYKEARLDALTKLIKLYEEDKK